MKDKLPKGWEFKVLGEISDINIGKTPPRENPKYFQGDKVWLSIRDLKNFQVDNSNEKLTSEAVEKFKINLVKKGTLLMSFKLTLGKLAFANCDLYTNEAIAALPIKNNFLKNINEKYLFYSLNFIDLEDEVDNAVKGKTLNKQKLKNLRIPLPPLPEQKQIVSVLDKTFEKLDQAIALVEENIQKLKQLNESVLDEVFSKLEREENKFRLVDIANVKRGKSKHRPRNDKRLYGGSYPLIQTGDIRNAEKFITKFSQTYNEKGLEQSKLWKKGTICLTIAANIGDVAILGIDACFPDSVVGIYSKEYNNTYIFYFLKSIQRKLDEKSSASAQKNLSVEKLSDFYIPLPDKVKQQRIVAYLDHTTEKNQQLITYYQNKLQALKSLKNSVLDSSFKGELRREKIIPINQPLTDPYFAKAKKNADKQAMVIALSIEAHEKLGKSLYRTKGEKTVEVIEKRFNLDFGREAEKMTAGPADFKHLVNVVEPLAHEKKWFYTQEIKGENYDSHKYIKAENFNLFMMRCVQDLKPNLDEIRRIINLFANIRTTHEAEVITTTYTGWNNLLIRKVKIDNDAIVSEARENWHEAKLKIDRQEFFDAIDWLKNNNLIPQGNGKEVL